VLLLLLGNNLVLGDGLGDDTLLLGLGDSDVVGEGALGTDLAGGIPREHDLNLQAENTLAKENVADSVVNVVLGGLTGVNHESVNELHALSAGGTELAGHNDLATLGTSLHDEAEDTVASSFFVKKKKICFRARFLNKIANCSFFFQIPDIMCSMCSLVG